MATVLVTGRNWRDEVEECWDNGTLTIGQEYEVDRLVFIKDPEHGAFFDIGDHCFKLNNCYHGYTYELRA